MSSECFCLLVVRHCSSAQSDCHWQYSQERFCLHCCDRHRALTLMCQNSPWRWSCECCNIYCLPSGCHCSFGSNSVVITWHVLIGTSSKRATYNYMDGVWMRLEYKVVNAQGQSKSCYQECGCHFLVNKLEQARRNNRHTDTQQCIHNE